MVVLIPIYIYIYMLVLISPSSSQAAGPLGKFLRTVIRVLNVEDIGLGSSGFLKLQEDMPEEVKLVSINIRF